MRLCIWGFNLDFEFRFWYLGMISPTFLPFFLFLCAKKIEFSFSAQWNSTWIIQPEQKVNILSSLHRELDKQVIDIAFENKKETTNKAFTKFWSFGQRIYLLFNVYFFAMRSYLPICEQVLWSAATAAFLYVYFFRSLLKMLLKLKALPLRMCFESASLFRLVPSIVISTFTKTTTITTNKTLWDIFTCAMPFTSDKVS